LYKGIHKLSDVNTTEGIELKMLSILLDRLKTGEERAEGKDVKIRCNGA
jgi:hypothetical protein